MCKSSFLSMHCFSNKSFLHKFKPTYYLMISQIFFVWDSLFSHQWQEWWVIKETMGDCHMPLGGVLVHWILLLLNLFLMPYFLNYYLAVQWPSGHGQDLSNQYHPLFPFSHTCHCFQKFSHSQINTRISINYQGRCSRKGDLGNYHWLYAQGNQHIIKENMR